jgi:multiple sugar transport system permease protein
VVATVSHGEEPITTEGHLEAERLLASPATAGGPPAGRIRRRSGLHRGENLFGWLFVPPSLVLLFLFLILPIVLAVYISFTNWSGLTSPTSSAVKWVGLQNYKTLLTQPGLSQTNFGAAIRNNFYFVIFTVPLQTTFALWLAVLINNRFIRGRGFFRTAYYFPSITSSIAITTIFIFLFQGAGVVNTILGWVGIKGPNWLYDQQGVFWDVLNFFGVTGPPGWANHMVLGISVWDWISGPSVGMCFIIILAVFTTSGTFMLFFLAALQNINDELGEAAEIDGATGWQRFRQVTLPMLRPALVLVLTLGFISTWQIFDQIFLTASNPTVITPAYLSYQVSFTDSAFGEGAAVAFLLFCLIIFLTVLQRSFIKEDLTK